MDTLTDEQIAELESLRPQDIHDDLLPLRPGLYVPDDEDTIDLLSDCYATMLAIVETPSLPKWLRSQAKALLPALIEQVTWHRCH
jgi:hypothetical protein